MIAKKIFWAVLCVVLIFGGRAFAAEGRIEISSGPFTIGPASPGNPCAGSYFLSHDIDNGSSGTADAIVVNCDHVNIDLGGHTITVNGAFNGISNVSPHSDIEVKNGKIVSAGSGVSGITYTVPNATGGEFRIYGVTVIAFGTSGISIAAAGFADPRLRAVVSGSSIVGPTPKAGTGILIAGAQSSRIEENQVRWASVGLHMTASVDSMISRNIFNQNASHGIWLDTGTLNCEVTDNVVTANLGEGIYVKMSGNHIISGNECSFNSLDGIHLETAPNNMVAHNNASNNGSGLGAGNDGIYVNAASTQNTLDWNLTSANTNCGIDFAGGGNVFSYNRSKGNAGAGPAPAPAYCGVAGNTNVYLYPTIPGATIGGAPAAEASTNQ